MPVENEYKYVLRDSRRLRSALGANGVSLRQAYLSAHNRIRSVEGADGAVDRWFTFKMMTSEGLVEIENAISETDFDRLWPLSGNRLSKTRFSFDLDGHWDVDLFGDLHAPYFVMAEVELPEGTPEPPIADFLAPDLIAAVGKDPAFSSHRLSDEQYARQLLATLERARA
ncbi:MAG: hypothetical protein DI537_10190 [Stutzerimonas stutzeri]|nr:MAG: hypothetical protein DI537_10190 [Stutzerimonas stutzeri]